MNPVFMLVYTSKSSKPVDMALLKNILEISQSFNLRDKITGFLVERSEYFLQLLEGGEAVVRACYKRIVADPRHTNITLQGEAYSDTRLLPDWSMGFIKEDTKKKFPENIISLFELGRDGKTYSDPESLIMMLRVFTKGSTIVKF